jgi:hypothetical protein
MSDNTKVERAGEHEEPQDEVEAHHRHVRPAANEEPAQEGEGGDDEVEAHMKHVRVAAPDMDSRSA